MPSHSFESDWLQDLAHDLRTPIDIIHGALQLVENGGPLTPMQQRFLVKAQTGLERIERLVERALVIAWLSGDEPLELVECDLKVLIADAIRLVEDVAEKRGVSIRFESDTEVPHIRADMLRLSQVIDNLLSNAIKYNRQDGEIHVAVSSDTQEVLVSIQDNGIGIPVEDQPYVFDRFFRARERGGGRIEGTGLGLAIARAIVERHHGRIWLESEPGHGTTIFFTIPLKTSLSEGDDQQIETSPQVAEPDESNELHQGGGQTRASEEPDAVDDAWQEQRNVSQVNTSGDKS